MNVRNNVFTACSVVFIASACMKVNFWFSREQQQFCQNFRTLRFKKISKATPMFSMVRNSNVQSPATRRKRDELQRTLRSLPDATAVPQRQRAARCGGDIVGTARTFLWEKEWNQGGRVWHSMKLLHISCNLLLEPKCYLSPIMSQSQYKFCLGDRPQIWPRGRAMGSGVVPRETPPYQSYNVFAETEMLSLSVYEPIAIQILLGQGIWCGLSFVSKSFLILTLTYLHKINYFFFQSSRVQRCLQIRIIIIIFIV